MLTPIRSASHKRPAMDEPPLPLPGLSPVAGRSVKACVDDGSLSSDAGVLVPREVERRPGVAERLAGCLENPRDPALITHALADMVCFRMLTIAAGYDATSLRSDPVFRMRRGSRPPAVLWPLSRRSRGWRTWPTRAPCCASEAPRWSASTGRQLARTKPSCASSSAASRAWRRDRRGSPRPVIDPVPQRLRAPKPPRSDRPLPVASTRDCASNRCSLARPGRKTHARLNQTGWDRRVTTDGRADVDCGDGRGKRKTMPSVRGRAQGGIESDRRRMVDRRGWPSLGGVIGAGDGGPTPSARRRAEPACWTTPQIAAKEGQSFGSAMRLDLRRDVEPAGFELARGWSPGPCRRGPFGHPRRQHRRSEKEWYHHPGSNGGPLDPQSSALTS